MRTFDTADLFAGGGGTSTGLVQAIKEKGDDLNLLAINHDPDAVRTHELNYPWATHFCQDVERVDPREAVPSGHLDLLVASPSCTHHSRALGGKPRNFQDRDDARIVSHWAYRLDIDNILIENVPEFREWGPLDGNDQPIKAQKGLHFNAWKHGLSSLRYSVDLRVLNAADYGDPTSRRRLFLIARKGNLPITWPSPVYDRKGANGLPKWRAAREIIDWTLEGESIFQRSKPLSPNTLKRILEGLKKFGGPEAKPFIIQMENGGHVDSIDSPLRTITANRKGGTVALVQPFILPLEGFHRGNTPKSIDDPLGTITAARGYGHLIQPFLSIYHGGRARVQSTDQPIPTLDTQNRFGLVEPYLVEYHSHGKPRSIDEPAPTVTTHDRLALVQPEIRANGVTYRMDIKYRMLQPHELSAAMGFPQGYRFAGTKTSTVKMIGNAVAVNMAKALVTSLLYPAQEVLTL